MNPKKRTIIFGIDGGTWDLLKPLAEKGDLPTLKRLMEEGAYGTLLSCIPCRSALSVATFFTGKNPCKWGMLDFPAFDPDLVVYKKIKEKAQALWDILGESGYKSAIINLPCTHPPTPTSGIMISGFAVSEQDEYTYPKELKEQVKSFHAKRETFLDMAYARVTMESEQERLDFYIKNIKERYAIVRDILKNKAFDFLVFWLDESDAAQHVFWGKEKILSAFFREIDNIIKDIVEQNPESNLIIFSDHGFDNRPTHEFYPKSWLEREGYLKLKGGKIQRWAIRKINTFMVGIHPRFRYQYIGRLYSVYGKIKNIINRGFDFPRKANSNDSPRQNWREIGDNRVSSKVIGIDWKKTISTNYDFWGIRITKENLDRDYEEVREEILKKMKQLEDETGQKIIKNAWKREEIFKGSDIQKFPDIVYLPSSKFKPTGFLPSFITKMEVLPLKRGGDHLTSREGVFIAFGPDIKNIGKMGEINMVDIAPTVFEVLRVPVPKDMDGRALKEIII